MAILILDAVSASKIDDSHDNKKTMLFAPPRGIAQFFHGNLIGKFSDRVALRGLIPLGLFTWRIFMQKICMKFVRFQRGILHGIHMLFMLKSAGPLSCF